MGQVGAEILAPRPDEAGRLVAEVLQIERAGWKGRAHTAIARDPRLGRFFRSFATAAAADGMLRIAVLRIADRVAAMQIGVETGQRFWLLRVGYREEFARCSPGVLLMEASIRYSARAGLEFYEFLGTEEPWIRPWTRLSRPCIGISVYPTRPRGAVAAFRDAARVASGAMKKSATPSRHAPSSAAPRASRR
jgi:CelD/BcsL family acetyltransferase involved in cellulose biosynthesis